MCISGVPGSVCTCVGKDSHVQAIRQDLLFKTHRVTLLPFNLVSVAISQAQKPPRPPQTPTTKILHLSRLCRIRSFRIEMVSGSRIPKSWRASRSCSLEAPMKEFSRKAGRPPTPSCKIYRGTRTRPKTCEGEQTGQDIILTAAAKFLEQIPLQNKSQAFLFLRGTLGITL